MDARFTKTVEFLRARIPVPPVVGVILGSGLGDFAAAVEDRVEIPYGQIPGFPASAVVGHAGTLVAGTLGGAPIVVLAGRIHYYEGHPMSLVVTPARVLGLEEGDAHVIRNAGGVVSDDAIRSLAISQRLLGTEEIILIHHTDCGMLTFSDDEVKDQIHADTGIRPSFALESFSDLDDDIRQSVARIQASPFVPRKDRVRGFVYEVETGKLREVT